MYTQPHTNNHALDNVFANSETFIPCIVPNSINKKVKR